MLGCTSQSISSSDSSLLSRSEILGRSIECLVGDGRMNFVYHSHSYNASAVPFITTAFLPTHVMPSALHAIPLFEHQSTHACPFNGRFIFNHNVLVFMEQIRGPLRNCPELVIQGTRKLTHQNESCLVSFAGLLVLSGQDQCCEEGFWCYDPLCGVIRRRREDLDHGPLIPEATYPPLLESLSVTT